MKKKKISRIKIGPGFQKLHDYFGRKYQGFFLDQRILNHSFNSIVFILGFEH